MQDAHRQGERKEGSAGPRRYRISDYFRLSQLIPPISDARIKFPVKKRAHPSIQNAHNHSQKKLKNKKKLFMKMISGWLFPLNLGKLLVIMVQEPNGVLLLKIVITTGLTTPEKQLSFLL